MKTITKSIAALAITAAAGVPMSGVMPMGNMDSTAMHKMMQDVMPPPNHPSSTKDFRAADMKMMHNLHVPYTGNRTWTSAPI